MVNGGVGTAPQLTASNNLLDRQFFYTVGIRTALVHVHVCLRPPLCYEGLPPLPLMPPGGGIVAADFVSLAAIPILLGLPVWASVSSGHTSSGRMSSGSGRQLSVVSSGSGEQWQWCAVAVAVGMAGAVAM